MGDIQVTLLIGFFMLISYIWAKIPYGMTAVFCCRLGLSWAWPWYIRLLRKRRKKESCSWDLKQDLPCSLPQYPYRCISFMNYLFSGF